MSKNSFTGVIAAIPTAFNQQGQINLPAFIEHANWCLDNGCSALNVLGTTGEANSLSIAQRRIVMEGAVAHLDGKRLMVGTGMPDIETTVYLTKLAYDLGFQAALVLPPYYYKPIYEDEIFQWFAQLVELTASHPIDLYLYNFPQMTGIEFSLLLTQKLFNSFRGRLKGAKDSSGKMDYARDLAKIGGFSVFPSNEASLAEADRSGFTGCISATVNCDPANAFKLWQEQQNETLATEVLSLRVAISANPLIPSVKYLVFKRSNNSIWKNVAVPHLPIKQQSHIDVLTAIADRLSVSNHQSA